MVYSSQSGLGVYLDPLDREILHNVLCAHGVQLPSDPLACPQNNAAIQQMIDILLGGIVGDPSMSLLEVLRALGYDLRNGQLEYIMGHRFFVANTPKRWPIVQHALAYLARLVERVQEPLKLVETEAMSLHTRLSLYIVKSPSNHREHSRAYLQQLRDDQQSHMAQCRQQFDKLEQLQHETRHHDQLKANIQRLTGDRRAIIRSLCSTEESLQATRQGLRDACLKNIQLSEREARLYSCQTALEQQHKRDGPSQAYLQEQCVRELESAVTIARANVAQLAAESQALGCTTAQQARRVLGANLSVPELVARFKERSIDLEGLQSEGQALQDQIRETKINCNSIERHLAMQQQLESGADPITPALAELAHKASLLQGLRGEMEALEQVAARAQLQAARARQLELPEFDLPGLDEILARLRADFEAQI